MLPSSQLSAVSCKASGLNIRYAVAMFSFGPMFVYASSHALSLLGSRQLELLQIWGLSLFICKSRVLFLVEMLLNEYFVGGGANPSCVICDAGAKATRVQEYDFGGEAFRLDCGLHRGLA